jgi:2-oxoglutarate/2-oxoacid ferredoxin oxidoreductase subunit beta
MPRMGENLHRYLREEMMPGVWCPGCGHGNVLRGIATALDRLHQNLDRVVCVGGIGCAGRSPFYLNTSAMHTTHGRALAFATGLKTAQPELTVLVTMGDGDAAAIGGNHFIHACRRNVDLTAIIYNNGTYGMTGGQQAPTTPSGMRSTTTPLGAIEPPFDLSELARAAGASYVARTTTFDFEELPQYIAEAIAHPGFAVVEVLTQCPTYFGRMNHLGDPATMLDYERDLTFPVAPMTREQVSGKLAVGRFRREIVPEYTARYADLCDRARAAAEREPEVPDTELPPGAGALPHDPYQVRFSGEGGQGVILAGVLLADAACAEGLQAVQTQSYGPEARGGACKSEVVLSAEAIAFPEVDRPDVVVCLSPEAIRKYPALAPGGVRLIEERASEGRGPGAHDIVLPMLQAAMEAGGAVAVNVVALGALAGLTGIVSREALLAVLRGRVRPDFLPLNERALEAGLRLGAGVMAMLPG